MRFVRPNPPGVTLAPTEPEHDAAHAELHRTRAELEQDEARASRKLWQGLASLAVLVILVICLLAAVPSLHKVAHEVTSMAWGWVLAAIGFKLLSCVAYIIAFLQVFDRAPVRFGARVALSELAFGAAVSLGGAGSVAVGAMLLIERGGNPSRVAERSAVLFLLTSAINVITLAAVGLLLWIGVLPGVHDPLLSLLPGVAGLAAILGFMAMPRLADRFLAERQGRVASWMMATAGTVTSTEQILRRPDWRLIGAWGYLWCDIFVLLTCFWGLGLHPQLSTVVLAYQIGFLVNFIPIPGGVGVVEGGFVALFALYGVAATPAAAATVVYHAISLWIPAMWGTGAFLMLRRSRGEPLTLRPPRAERIAARQALRQHKS
ncbi:MAG: UPF0104 family protein [Solirubrobacterales bacterium]|nr:UPF0104 family protein [Solirubrobacterales bacterium]